MNQIPANLMRVRGCREGNAAVGWHARPSRQGRAALAKHALIVLCCIWAPPPANAGIFLPAESEQPVNAKPPERFSLKNLDESGIDFTRFHARLYELRGAMIDRRPPTKLREYLLKSAAALEAKPADTRTVEDGVNLSGYLIRLAMFQEAVDILTPLAADPTRCNFMVLANLATAYQQLGRLDRAEQSLDQCVRSWPNLWPGWSRKRLAAYRRLEALQLALIKERYNEELRQPGQQAAQPDALFPHLRFAGADGAYQAGGLSAAQLDDLPSNAIAMVEQLMLWLPTDDRLYWLLGELLNSQGQVLEATTVFSNISDDGYSTPEFRRHRQVIDHAAQILRQFVGEAHLQALWMFAPYPTLARAVLVGMPIPDDAQSDWSRTFSTGTSDAPNPTESTARLAEPESARQWLPDLRTVVVSFTAGMLVGLIAAMQLRVFLRRIRAQRKHPKFEYRHSKQGPIR